MKGARWTMLSYATNKVVTLISTAILARILAPADFGLLALAAIGIGVLLSVNDLGLGGTLIVRHDLDRRQQGVMLSLVTGMGALLGIGGIALSPFTSHIFGDSRVPLLFATLSMCVAISGPSWFFGPLLHRELCFREHFVAQLSQTVVYAIVTTWLAVDGAGVWSFVYGQIAGLVVFSIALVWLAPYRIAPRFDVATSRELLAHGKGFLAQGALAFFSQNSDNFIVGRVLGATSLGLYSMAYRIAEIPYLAIANPISQVTFPRFAKMRHNGEDVAPEFLHSTKLIAFATAPIGALLAGASLPMITVVYGSQWKAASPAMAVLGVWAIVRPVQSAFGWLLNSAGKAHTMAQISFFLLCLQVVELLVAVNFFSIQAVAIVMLSQIFISLGILSTMSKRTINITFTEITKTLRCILLAAAATALVANACVRYSPSHSALATSGLAALAGAVSYIGVLLIVDNSFIRTTFSGLGDQTVGRVLKSARRSPAPPVKAQTS